MPSSAPLSPSQQALPPPSDPQRTILTPQPLVASGARERFIKPYHEAVVAAIRQYDPDNVIILGTRTWSQRPDEAAANPVAGSNLGYTMHFYSCAHANDPRPR